MEAHLTQHLARFLKLTLATGERLIWFLCDMARLREAIRSNVQRVSLVYNQLQSYCY